MKFGRRFPATAIPAVVLPSLLASLLATAGPAHATPVQILYAVTGTEDDNCSGAPANLYTIDPSNGAAALVAPVTIDNTQIAHVTGLAVHPSTGVLYAVQAGVDSECADYNTSTLITIDSTTGAATVIGSANSLDGRYEDITFDAFGTLYGWDEVGDTIDEIDITNGTKTAIGTPKPGTNTVGLASDSTGRLFVNNGSDAYVSQFNQYTGDELSGVTTDRFSGPMLAFDISDVPYSGELTESGFTLFTINLATGATTTVGSNAVMFISALAFAHSPVTPPPVSDLSLAKSVAPDVVALGSDAVFTLEVTNDGPNGAGNVVVLDVLPDGFTYVSQSGDGTYDSTTGEWTIAAISESTSATIEITATATTAGEYVNTAEVIASASYDSDSVPGSGDVDGDTYDSVAVKIVPPSLFSIDRNAPALWRLDEPGFSTVDMRKEIWASGHDICGGDALANQPSTNSVFGVVRTGDCTARSLATIDAVTGETILKGGFSGKDVSGIAFAGDGTLYAATDSSGSSPETLFTVDPTDASTTAVCKLASGEGHALAYAGGRLLHATRVCDGDCELRIEVIDPASLPADPADPCSAVLLHTGGNNYVPTAMALKSSGSGFFLLRLANTDASLYYMLVADTFDSAAGAFLANLWSFSGGLAYSPADVTVANLVASKTATKQRVKGQKMIDYTVGASNEGPDDVGNVVLTDFVPSGTSVLSMSPGCQNDNGTITCSSSWLESGEQVQFNISVAVTCKKCTSVFNQVFVDSDDDIYDFPLDNDDSLSTTVKGKF